jgi:hypothetical protein
MSLEKALDKYVTELILLAKALCPEAIIDVLFTRYGDEDAHSLVYPSEDTSETDMDKLGEALIERSVQIHIETNLFILVGVHEARQRRQLRDE